MRLYLSLIVVSALLIFLDSKLILTPIKAQAQTVFAPFTQSLENIDLGNSLFSQTIRERDQKIQELESTKVELLGRLSQDKRLEEENIAMRRLLGSQVPPSWKFEPARKSRIVGDELFLTSQITPSLRTQVISVSEGQNLGIYIGYSGERVGNTTQVLLPTHPLSRLSAVVRKSDSLGKRSSGILEGRGGRVILTQVLVSDTIENGDLVLVADSGEDLQELLVGKITQVNLGQNTSFKQADLELVFNPKDLDYVFYLTKK